LSGGQQQRLAIARMAHAKSRVVVLGEASPALDTKTEARVYQAPSTFLANRTTLIVAHRSSAIRRADRVYVFADGHIVEEGLHDELSRSRGLYHKPCGSGLR
jgi:ATP-binding cassette subfamily C protein